MSQLNTLENTRLTTLRKYEAPSNPNKVALEDEKACAVLNEK